MGLVDEAFDVPEVHMAKGFRLELLGPEHNESDHRAWTTSIEHIRATPGFGDDWPPVGGMTLEENLADLRGHAARSARREDFAYAVLDPATREVIGCVYLKPGPPGDVRVLSWVRADRSHLDEPLTVVVTRWLAESWPFEVIGYR
ncbi:N-acetyltransferase [Actinoplanes sp. NPDC023714]|uniref:N-acetyltransferase n=1 Tax=Actinoplanes sp. NPDC023714 TaxID=3154322 RepID=UPI003409B6C8